MAEHVVEASDLWFTYKPSGLSTPKAAPSLSGVSLSIRPGEVYGVLGPNGAGKTTLIKILCTLILPDKGDLRVFGERLPGGESFVRPRLGISLGEYERTFHFRLTARQNLRFFGNFLDIPRGRLEPRIEEVLAEVGLADAADKMFLSYSTGMKHRLAVARALLGRPDLLVFDEPTAGLDVETSRQLGDLILRLAREEGATVIYTTHRLEEAGRLCDRIAILRRGRVVAEETPQRLRSLAAGSSVIALDLDRLEPAFLADCKTIPGVREVHAEGRTQLRVQVRDLEDAIAPLIALAAKHGLLVRGVRTEAPTVEDAFRSLTKGVEFHVVTR